MVVLRQPIKDPVLGDCFICPRCGELWPADLEFFYTSKNNKHGLSSWCRACKNEDVARRKYGIVCCE